MHKSNLNLVFSAMMSSLLLLLVPVAAQALTIEVTDQGNFNFYQGAVLGKTDNQGNASKAKDNPGQDKKNEAEEEDEVLVKQIGKYQQQEVEILPSTTGVGLQVKVKDKEQVNNPGTGDFVRTEETAAEKVKVKLPKLDSLEIDSANTGSESAEEDDEVELEIGNNDEGLQIKSNGVTARTTSALFTLGSDGMVTLTTPSGNTHQLRHYPEQAIRVMLAKGKMSMTPTPSPVGPGAATPSAEPVGTESADLDSGEAGDEIVTDLEIVESETGQVFYQANVLNTKRVFGFIPRQFNELYILNDDTGEVSVQLAEDETIFDRLLNAVSID